MFVIMLSLHHVYLTGDSATLQTASTNKLTKELTITF